MTKIESVSSSLNSLRIIPRAMCGMYGWMFFDMYRWYTELPDPSSQQTAFASAVIGAAAAFFGLYVTSGK